jgi:hypothetical protein
MTSPRTLVFCSTDERPATVRAAMADRGNRAIPAHWSATFDLAGVVDLEPQFVGQEPAHGSHDPLAGATAANIDVAVVGVPAKTVTASGQLLVEAVKHEIVGWDAGPIVHYREMMPQFASASCRFDKENFAVGLTLLFFGLFKKVVLADNIAPLITPIYQHSAAGGHTPFLLAWMAAVGFTLQVYFDFSGYTDMALWLGRFFGKLPPNFNSPLKASSIIDFWLRWHMTLTRFLTDYIYSPLVLWLTRRRLEKGRPGFAGRNPTAGARR